MCHTRHHGTELFLGHNEITRVIHRGFYTQTLLHADAFTHTHTLSHTEAFTHRPFYTQRLLHTDTFTNRHFYPQKLYTHTHTLAFLLHTHTHFHTQRLLYTDAYTEAWAVSGDASGMLTIQTMHMLNIYICCNAPIHQPQCKLVWRSSISSVSL